MKARRQTKILELIKDKRIETQEELLNELRGQGFNVTQATVSRDIRELNLSKVSVDGHSPYKTESVQAHSGLHGSLLTKKASALL